MKKFLILALIAVAALVVMAEAVYTQNDLENGNWVIQGNVVMEVSQWMDVTLRDINTNNIGDIKPLLVYDYGENYTWNPENSNPMDQNKYGTIELTITTNALIKMAITGVTTSPNDITSYIESIKWRLYRQSPPDYSAWRPVSGWEDTNSFILINDIDNGYTYISWNYIQLMFDLKKDLPANRDGYTITLDIAFQPTVTL